MQLIGAKYASKTVSPKSQAEQARQPYTQYKSEQAANDELVNNIAHDILGIRFITITS